MKAALLTFQKFEVRICYWVKSLQLLESFGRTLRKYNDDPAFYIT
ncbi:MAG: hypothetical protein ABIW47_08925 [Ginsengibacter sp.]